MSTAIKNVSVTELAKAMKSSNSTLILLDVREPWEIDFASIENSVNIPMNQVPERLSEIPTDKEIVVMCHHGGRSLSVAQFLAHHGFNNISNLTGGIHSWSLEIDQSVPTY